MIQSDPNDLGVRADLHAMSVKALVKELKALRETLAEMDEDKDGCYISVMTSRHSHSLQDMHIDETSMMQVTVTIKAAICARSMLIELLLSDILSGKEAGYGQYKYGQKEVTRKD